MSKEFLTSRQRVINAVEHKAVDRMPIDLGAHTSTGISAFAYYNLRKYLGLSTDNIEMVDCVQNLARVDDDIIERFHHLDKETSRAKTEQSFFVDRADIVANEYDLSINKYKQVEYKAVEYPPTSEIFANIEKIEAEIAKEMAELKKLLEV